MLDIQDIGAVRVLSMDAPKKLNALSDAMIADLTAAFDELETSAIRCVVLRGYGNAFCAGHDLSEMAQARQATDRGAAALADLFDRCAQLMQKIRALPQPVIAQVHGIATAAGCQLVASCDLAVAAEGTRFGVNGVNIGLFCSTPMVALSRKIPAKPLFEMLVTGEFIGAERACELGLINRVVPEGELADATMGLAETIAGQLGAAVKIGKQAFYRQAEMPLEQAYAYAGEAMVENMGVPETQRGIDNFLHKRPQNLKQ